MLSLRLAWEPLGTVPAPPARAFRAAQWERGFVQYEGFYRFIMHQGFERLWGFESFRG